MKNSTTQIRWPYIGFSMILGSMIYCFLLSPLFSAGGYWEIVRENLRDLFLPWVVVTIITTGILWAIERSSSR